MSNLQRRLLITRPVATTLVTVVLFLANAATCPAADQMLAHERWMEHSHGMSFRPPLGSRLYEQTADDALVRVQGEEGYAIHVYLKDSDEIIDTRLVVEAAIQQMAISQPGAVLLERRSLEIAGRPGAYLYFKVPDIKRGPFFIMGQALAQVDGDTFLVVRLECTERMYKSVRPIFEALIESVEIQDPDTLTKLRQEQILAGERWREGIDSRRLHAARTGEQWYRMLENSKDIGYIRIEQRADKQMDLPGLRMDMQSRIILGNQAVDSLSNFFLSDDGSTEVWSTRTTVRPQGAQENRKGRSLIRDLSYAETGLRVKDRITVTRDGPEGKKKHQWETPPKGYLSQVEVHMLGGLLPGRSEQELGFYAYYSNLVKLSYRSERVEPGKNGQYTVYSRPSPEHPEQISTYDAQGRLMKRVLPDGRALVPATLQEINTRWKLKG